MEVSAVTRNVRLSAQKGRPLAREVQGKPVSEALKIVAFSLIGRYSPMENGITGTRQIISTTASPAPSARSPHGNVPPMIPSTTTFIKVA